MKDVYHRMLRKIARFQVEHPLLTVLLITTLTIAIASGMPLVKTVASLEQMMPQDEPSVAALNDLRDAGMGKDIVAIVIEIDHGSQDPYGITDINDLQVEEYIAHLEAIFQDEPDILRIRDPMIDHDASTAALILETDVAADDLRMGILAGRIDSIIADAGHPPGITIRTTGTPIIQQRLATLIQKDRTDTSWISLLLVFIITALVFASFSSALVPIAIVAISVIWLYGTMGHVGLPISTLAGGVAAMVIGIGIDFAIHIMNKFKHERKQGKKIPQAIELAVVETGTALTATSLTTIAAFLAFLIGSMPEMGRFGMLMAIGITYALIFSLFGLPALLILEEKVIDWIRRTRKFGIEGEYHLEGKR